MKYLLYSRYRIEATQRNVASDLAANKLSINYLPFCLSEFNPTGGGTTPLRATLFQVHHVLALLWFLARSINHHSICSVGGKTYCSGQHHRASTP